MPSGKVLQIFICVEKGDPMVPMEEVVAIEGRGLEGDRYAAGVGEYPTGRNHVTFIALEAIGEANRELLPEPFLISETRRNIVTQSVPLNDLVGKEFSIGEVRFRGVKLCPPCTRPAVVAGRGLDQGKLFRSAFKDRGGLNAEVLEGGLIRVGDPIIYD